PTWIRPPSTRTWWARTWRALRPSRISRRRLREGTVRRSSTASRLMGWGRHAVRGIGPQLMPLAVAFLIVAVVLLVSGYNALTVFQTLLGSFVTDFYGMLRWATPLILTGLATAVAFRARVWNIGMDGQLYVGALAGAAIG